MFEHHLWDWYASCYDTVTQLDPYQRMLDDLLDILDVQPGMRLLNAGCGTGNLECRLHARGLDCQVTAVDFSDVMLRRARRKCQGQPVTFQRVNLDAPLPFADGSFDRIVSTNVLYALPRPEWTLAELTRVLTPAGRMAHASPIDGFRMAPIFRAHWRQAPGFRRFNLLWSFPSFCALILFNLVLLGRQQRGQYRFFTESEALALLHAIGPTGQLTRTYADQDWLLMAERS